MGKNQNLSVFESIYSNIVCDLEDYEKMEIHNIEERMGQNKIYGN